MARLVDFHCHLDLYRDHLHALRACEEEQVYTLSVTTTPKAWPRNRDLTRDTRYIRAALGLHPQLVGEREAELGLWERFAGDARYIGEVGLDANRDHRSSLEAQQRVFERVVSVCEEQGGKILSVHSVRAAGMVLDMLDSLLTRERGKVILHWFSGTSSELSRAIDLGCYFSVNRNMTMSTRGRQIIAMLPEHVLLTETDGPFATVDERPAFPTDVAGTVAEISRIRGTEEGYTAAVIWGNAKRLLQDSGE